MNIVRPEDIDWMKIEEHFTELENVPDCIPTNVREWTAFASQYEKVVDLCEGRIDYSDAPFTYGRRKKYFYGVLGIKEYKRSVLELHSDLGNQVLSASEYIREYFPGVVWSKIDFVARILIGEKGLNRTYDDKALEKTFEYGTKVMYDGGIIEDYSNVISVSYRWRSPKEIMDNLYR